MIDTAFEEIFGFYIVERCGGRGRCGHNQRIAEEKGRAVLPFS